MDGLWDADSGSQDMAGKPLVGDSARRFDSGHWPWRAGDEDQDRRRDTVC